MIKNLKEQEQKFVSRDFPLNLLVEVGAYCNLNCIMCCNDSLTRKKGYMDMKLYRKIIDEVAEVSPGTRIWLDFVGEPLLARYKLYFMIDYAKKKGLTNVNLNTNGILLDDEMADMLLDSGIDFLSTDVDGFSKEVYEKIRCGGDRDVLYNNLLNFAEKWKKREGKKPYFEIKVIEMEENKHEVQQIVDYWLDKGVGVGVRVLGNWAGNLKTVKHDINQERIACGLAIGQLGVTWDGTATVCGDDCDATLACGDLNKESVQEVWKRKQSMIKLHMEHRFDELPKLCQQCTSWALAGSEEHYDPTGKKYDRSYEFDSPMV
ncbi:MAG: radical SAM protein [Lachnospiraceae bacterium]|nr:radical SAM protein [Lachnospiraceae bacterium]